MMNNSIYQFKNHLGLEHDNPFTIREAKATEAKTTKEVNQAETAAYDYKNPKNLNNQIFDQYINGLKFEMEQNPELLVSSPAESLLKAKDIVLKNLEKDPLFYTKNAAFGVKDLGYTEEAPGLTPKEITGKHKSSGYGDLKENNMKNSEKLVELLEEALAGVPSVGNPFAERKTASYEAKFAAYLAEEKEKAEEAANIDPGAEPKGFLKRKKDYKQLEEKTPKKEGKKQLKKQPKEVVKEVEKVAEMAANMVRMKEYKRQMDKLQETLTSINEDENLSEYIDAAKTKTLQDEIKVYEGYYTQAAEAYNYSKNNK